MAWNEPGPGKDPWSQGPKKGGGQPPDLDEMLRRLKERFGGSGSGSGSAGGLPRPRGLVGWVLLGLGLVWLSSGFYVVDEQERAVVLRFGQYVYTADPGPRMHLPWPIEREEVINVTGVRSVRDQATMLTKDENIVNVELSVQYRVSKVEDYVFNVDDPDMTLRQATKGAVREVVGQNLMDFILTDGRQEVADRTKILLQERLNSYHAGLSVTEVNLQQAQPPDEVQEAFADAIKAGQDKERLKNEAEAYANDRIPRARGAAARQRAEATAYREQSIARAEGDAARFGQLVREYRKAPQITRERMYLDAMSSVLGSTSKILVDVNKGNPMLYLPLEQLMKNAPRAEAAEDYSSSSGTQSQGNKPNDSGRSRERGR